MLPNYSALHFGGKFNTLYHISLKAKAISLLFRIDIKH